MFAEENQKRTEISELGEFGLIDEIKKITSLKLEGSKVGIGDDAAVIHNGSKQTVVSTDMLVEGVHFDLSYAPLKHFQFKLAPAYNS